MSPCLPSYLCRWLQYENTVQQWPMNTAENVLSGAFSSHHSQFRTTAVVQESEITKKQCTAITDITYHFNFSGETLLDRHSLMSSLQACQLVQQSIDIKILGVTCLRDYLRLWLQYENINDEAVDFSSWRLWQKLSQRRPSLVGRERAPRVERPALILWIARSIGVINDGLVTPRPHLTCMLSFRRCGCQHSEPHRRTQQSQTLT